MNLKNCLRILKALSNRKGDLQRNAPRKFDPVLLIVK